ncbi:RHS repeat-associated core domain-containing protein [Nocardia alba]|uniref:RHS repeat-associated core domain-containing protein n=1 Tax=Nocardia alba TaxID=225051 RepID=UPI002437233B|nr:RHS repeat-associated core domain-containing protein [Nocardia alba]
MKSAFGDIAKAFKKTPSKTSKNADTSTTPSNTVKADTPSNTTKADTPTNPASTPDTPSKTPDSGDTGSPKKTDPWSKEDQTTAANTDKSKLTNQDGADKPNLNKTEKQTTDCGDPVDAATGEFLLPETDVDLPGVLALVLTRRHRSSYRFGRWFGPSWAATLDMRVDVDQVGVKFVGPDGELWQFPHTAPDVPVTPVHRGIRATMVRTETGGYHVHDPDRELTWGFAPDPTLAGLDVQLGNYAISEITDRHHNRIRFHYNADGAPTHVTHSGGYRVDIDTDAGRVTALTVTNTDAAVTEGGVVATSDSTSTVGKGAGPVAAVVREFGYTAGNLTSVTNGVGAITQYRYDPDARMLSWRDSRGTEMHNTYDRSGRVVKQVGTDNILSATFVYEDLPEFGRTRTRHTNSLGATTIFEFDSELCLRNLINPRGGTSITDYNEYRQPVRHIDAHTNTTIYVYNPDGDLILLRRPDQQSITVTYAAPRRPATITDVDGATITHEYDENNNLARITDADGITTAYTYHSCGAPASIIHSTGATTSVDIDRAGLPIRITESDSAVTLVERDSFGRPIAITDPLGHTSTHQYSGEGKLLFHRGADGTTQSWTYDGEGNLLTHTNQIGGTTRYTYDTFDLVASRETPDGTVTAYTHDTERHLTSVTNPLGDTWTYEYDPTGNVCTETDYNGSVTHTEYDLLNRPTTIITPTGAQRRHAYDVLGRFAGISTDTGEWITHTHTASGKLASARNGHHADTIHAVAFTHSPAGRLLAQDVDGRTTTYDYDLHGRRTGYSTPTGSSTTYEYAPTGQIAALTTEGHRFDFTYDLLGRQNSWRTEGLGQHNTYNAAGHTLTRELAQLDPHTSAPTQLLERDEYTWRPDGYITSHTTTSPHRTRRRDYTLDVMGRITHITTPGGFVSEQYTYDALSNLTTVDIPTSPAPPDPAGPEQSEPAPDPRFEYRNNLLIRAGRTRYHYDSAGRLIRKEKTRISRKPAIWHYRYNAFDQLVEVTTPDKNTWSYTYDTLGRRTSRKNQDSGLRTEFVWDGSHLAEQSTTSSSGIEIQTWTMHPTTHVPLTQSIGDRFWAIVTNLQGSPTHLVDPATGDIASVAKASLWGRTHWTGPGTPHRFQGQQQDHETGLHYNHHRYYDPETGRYLTQDPLGLIPAPNSNIYPHNPITWTDPLGLTPCPEITDEGLQHSFTRHAHEWFGRQDHMNPSDTERYAEWRTMIEQAMRNKNPFEWSTGRTDTHGYLTKIDGKYFVAQFDRTSGELVTAFRPSSAQVAAMGRLTGWWS